MYAVIKTGGKQHRVTEGETLKIEKIEIPTGDVVQFDEVLLVSTGDDITIGSPLVDGAAVKAEVIQHGRAEKVRIIKFRRRKHSMKRQGHRQWFTEVKITDILASGAKKAAPAKKKVSAPKAAAKDAPKAAATNDLSNISGVGPVLVKKLADAGITSLEQIAAWTADDIASFDEKLNFKGRIERDDWVAQAKALIKGE